MEAPEGQRPATAANDNRHVKLEARIAIVAYWLMGLGFLVVFLFGLFPPQR